MSNEQTPLIQKVQVAPPRQRYPHHWLRRTCTILLSAIVLVVVIAVILVAFGVPIDIPGLNAGASWSNYFPPSGSWPESDGVAFKVLEKLLKETPDEEHAKKWNRYYTSGPHLSGKNLSQALWTRELWQEFGVENTNVVAYDIYINFPDDHRLALVDTRKGDKVLYEASLEEDVLKEDSTSGLDNRIPTYHGYSANGNVTAQIVFANYGTYHDFEDLVKANVSLEGKIALVKYGRIFRGLKVKRAQELGMIGTIIYSDPGDDGEKTEENGDKQYPKGPAREETSVQRGSVSFLSVAPGDPTTPGWPSKPGVPRVDPHHGIPSIPSLPISYMDALPLLKALNGHGPNTSQFNQYWQQGGLKYKGVDYNIGPSPSHIKVNLYNKQEYVTTPMWNVIGIINGSVPNEVIVMGNHRDAWIAGGAVDPNSGSAAFNEVIRSLGQALKMGWKPLRTIVLASWDGEEQGLIGSTEWVEEYLPWLQQDCVAYINVDVGTGGPDFNTAAAPLLDDVLTNATRKILSPNQTVAGQTVYDVWNKHIATMGSGSDFTAFQDFAGIPSLDMGFSPSLKGPVYHYHSNYDSFDWMDRFGDPGWHYHAAIARVWGVLAAALVDDAVIPFNASNYAAALARYLAQVETKAHKANLTSSPSAPSSAAQDTFRPLRDAIATFTNASSRLDARAASLRADLADFSAPSQAAARGPYRWYLRIKLWHRARAVNAQYQQLERRFLHPPGLPGRSWFKHFVFAPGLWTGYAGAVFPPLVEMVDDGDGRGLAEWVKMIARRVEFAAGSIWD